jgi:hypothetical protein
MGSLMTVSLPSLIFLFEVDREVRAFFRPLLCDLEKFFGTSGANEMVEKKGKHEEIERSNGNEDYYVI